MKTLNVLAVVMAVILLGVAGPALADSKEVKQPDASLLGVWKASVISKDLGVTQPDIASMTVATVTATTVKDPKGNISRIEKVVEVHDQGKDPVTLFKLSDGNVFTVTKKPKLFMLQVMSGNPLKEDIRFGFTVAK